jgi:hypothetical protein
MSAVLNALSGMGDCGMASRYCSKIVCGMLGNKDRFGQETLDLRIQQEINSSTSTSTS